MPRISPARGHERKGCQKWGGEHSRQITVLQGSIQGAKLIAWEMMNNPLYLDSMPGQLLGVQRKKNQMMN